MKKLKVAICWAAGCGGCDVGLLDIDDKLLGILDNVEILFWPVAMDIKYKELENLPDLDVSIISGSIRNEENEHIIKILRKKSKWLIAFGSCACEGGTLGLANLSTKKDLLKTVYEDSPTTVNQRRLKPSKVFKAEEGPLTLPDLKELNSPIDKIVDVDYYISGCPPQVELIADFFDRLFADKLPQSGSYLPSEKSVCDECSREKVSTTIKSLDRIYQKNFDPDKCFLEQGILCMGPATRGGCKGKCPEANMPCSGCGGRLNVPDQGARMIGALGAILSTDDNQNIIQCLDGLKDPVGVLYKYCFAASLIGKGVKIDRNKRKQRNERT